ncbi:MutS protein 3 [Schizosaccharomyces japonicus yFS275]|uniref:DNA mismatch repair protein MSH3 n=1 Tax=Schizosaccharomyces japonicus (strain yFS275 / FY16936) TaxID=402676 RepID=B6JXV6_SCHJY|nr:MutS protein 3 [Schizosaccharomyces japonicus yFS275]EEB06374.1 MutS protein 3 [Schizosaccharomyces japonicus yFS275]
MSSSSDDSDDLPIITLVQKHVEQSPPNALSAKKSETKKKRPSSELKRSTRKKRTSDVERNPSRPPSIGHTKYTPLEEQYICLKRRYPDTILAVEVGYKYRFFGEDARTVSSILHIGCYLSHNFMNASIPNFRADFHLQRLIHAGLKVGVVRQTETAALKSQSTTKSKIFERDVTEVYTRGTYLAPVPSVREAPTQGDFTQDSCILCVTEQPRGGTGVNEKVLFGIVAVNPVDGNVVYDEFEDSFLRGELQTRFSHLHPCELIYTPDFSQTSSTCIESYKKTEEKDGSLIWTQELKGITPDAAFVNIKDFYCAKFGHVKHSLLDLHLTKIINLPKLVLVCLSLMIDYMTEFSMENIFTMTQNFQDFRSSNTMLLSNNTLKNLEVFRNLTDYSIVGSLYWAVDHTYTRFGQRMLRAWIQRPLLNKEEIIKRQEAVGELAFSQSASVERLRHLLWRLPDLEKGLSKIYYKRASPAELLIILRGFYSLSSAFYGATKTPFHSTYLNMLIGVFPQAYDFVDELLSSIHPDEAQKNNKIGLWTDDKELLSSDSSLSQENTLKSQIREHKMAIIMAQADLQVHLEELQKLFNYPELEYKTWGNIEYCVELSRGCKTVPTDWIKLNSTARLARYHSPKISRTVLEINQHRESLQALSNERYMEFLDCILRDYEKLRNIVSAAASLDCLMSLAKVAAQPGYVKPEFTDDKFDLLGCRHPMVELLLERPYVSNDICLQRDGLRALLITGPNMGGKSSIIRQVALISILAQLGSFVPAKSARLPMLDKILTRMSFHDDMLNKKSTFMIEMNETQRVLRDATDRSLLVFDELGRGTSTLDGEAISYAVMNYLLSSTKAFILFVTHYPGLRVLEDLYPSNIMCCYMGYSKNQTIESHTKFSASNLIYFLYKLVPGTAPKSYGLNVAHMAKIPIGVLLRAEKVSANLEKKHKEKELSQFAKWIRHIISDEEGLTPKMMQALLRECQILYDPD